MNEEMKDALDWYEDGNLFYTLKHRVWDKGVEIKVNERMVNVSGDYAEETMQTIRKALQSRPVVDVEGLKKQVHIAHLKQAYGDHPDNNEDIEDGIINEEYAYHYGGEDAADFAIDRLHKQGLIGGVPDGFALVPVTMPDTFDNWMCDALYRQDVYSNDIKSQDVWSAVIKEAQKGKDDE